MDLLEGLSESDLRQAFGNPLPTALASPQLLKDAAREFRSFLCTNSADYSDLRQRWAELRDESTTAAAAALAAAIGARLGLSGAALAPLVACLLLSGLRLGCRTVCRHLEHGDVVSALQ